MDDLKHEQTHPEENNKKIINKKRKRIKNKSDKSDKNNNLKLIKNKINDEPKINIKNIYLLKNIANDAYSVSYSDNSFYVFQSFFDILYLIYSSKNNSIICYNLIDGIKMNEIRNAHYNNITNFRNYLDNINERDLIISISSSDNNVKLWNINNCECLLDLQNINNKGYLNSACFLSYNNQIYLVTSHHRFSRKVEKIKIT